MSEVLTVEEAAKLLRLSTSTVRDLARTGQIPARKVGREWRFIRSRLLRGLQGNDLQ